MYSIRKSFLLGIMWFSVLSRFAAAQFTLSPPLSMFMKRAIRFLPSFDAVTAPSAAHSEIFKNTATRAASCVSLKAFSGSSTARTAQVTGTIGIFSLAPPLVVFSKYISGATSNIFVSDDSSFNLVSDPEGELELFHRHATASIVE
uniref:Uncharacterized protein n=1 Tax=Corethron hystrix TaxID=216773 RepID=A0A7S1B886_9STRA|mmetsp:Transcript_16315/g.36707  ORF Transcript_16315/g.36707 Transcript_16315/m.36707 type:complete len:146 (+) Transcript_16315:136-573(+)